MEFSPFNKVVKLCLQGMEHEKNGNLIEAENLFLLGWKEATSDFEKFLSAHYIARVQSSNVKKLNWLEKSLEFALKVNDNSVLSALPSLYSKLASCYQELNDFENVNKYQQLANSYQSHPSDSGPFYHGTKANLAIGDLLKPGGNSNYQSDLKMNHIYFTALVNGAGLAAALAKGVGKERIYIIEPTGDFENDPNLTDKKFPGNPTRSYRSEFPLKIVGEVTSWNEHQPEDIQKFRDRLENNKGEIIN